MKLLWILPRWKLMSELKWPSKFLKVGITALQFNVFRRKADHEAANAQRKLTPAQKKAKNCRKLQEDTSAGVSVAVYRVKNLQNPAKKWKLEKNASQLFMSGTVVLYQDVNIVVVEGGPKQLKKYRQLMLKRVKWSEDTYTDKDGTEHNNKCELVWEVSLQRDLDTF